MNKQERISKAIKEVVSELMERVMNKVLITDPFIKEKHHSRKPLYAALVPDEIFKGSHFERRFVTPFGGVWEKLAMVVAKEAHGTVIKGHKVYGTVGSESLRRIQETLNKLEHRKKKNKVKPDWDKEIEYIKAGGGEPIPTTVICDIYIENEATGKKYAFELKGLESTSNQIRRSKEKLLKLSIMHPKKIDFTYYALPYELHNEKDNYDDKHLKQWFDLKNDKTILINNEFWELIGGKDTYQNLNKEIKKLGKNYKERIYKEFLDTELL